MKKLALLAIITIFFTACGEDSTTNLITNNLVETENNLFTLATDSHSGVITPGFDKEILTFTAASDEECQVDAIIFNIRDITYGNKVTELFLYDELGNTVGLPRDYRAEDHAYKLGTSLTITTTSQILILTATIHTGNRPNDGWDQEFFVEILGIEGTCTSNPKLEGSVINPRYNADIPAYVSLHPVSPSGLYTPGNDIELARFNLSTDSSLYYLGVMHFFILSDDFNKVRVNGCDLTFNGTKIDTTIYDAMEWTSNGGIYHVSIYTNSQVSITVGDIAPTILSLTCDVEKTGIGPVAIRAELMSMGTKPHWNYFLFDSSLPVTGGALLFD